MWRCIVKKNLLNTVRIFSVLMMAAFVSCSKDSDDPIIPLGPVKGAGDYIRIVRNGEPTLNDVVFKICDGTTQSKYNCTLAQLDNFTVYYGCSDILNLDSGKFITNQMTSGGGSNGRFSATIEFTEAGKDYKFSLYSYSEGETFLDCIKVGIEGSPDKTINVSEELKYTLGRNVGNFTVSGITDELLALGTSELKSKITVKAGKEIGSNNIQWTPVDDFEVKVITGKIHILFTFDNSKYQINLSKTE